MIRGGIGDISYNCTKPPQKNKNSNRYLFRGAELIKDCCCFFLVFFIFCFVPQACVRDYIFGSLDQVSLLMVCWEAFLKKVWRDIASASSYLFWDASLQGLFVRVWGF